MNASKRNSRFREHDRESFIGGRKICITIHEHILEQFQGTSVAEIGNDPAPVIVLAYVGTRRGWCCEASMN